MIYHFDILSSTNDEAFDPRYGEGDVVWAGQQTAGRGSEGISGWAARAKI